MREKVADEPVSLTVLKIFANPSLRTAGIQCIKSIFFNFFFRQYRAFFLPGRIPVSSVDHPLDDKIPFTPKRVTIYLDFIAFWIRMTGFLLRVYQRKGIAPVKHFISAMGQLYTVAAQVYSKNLSTTNRPHYFARPRFVLIHATDPHLMCIPSLHVMVVILTYTKFRDIIRSMGDIERFTPQIEEIRRYALDITEAILYVKQHSINCVAASLYAMTRFDPALFPPEEAACFVSELFIHAELPKPEDTTMIRNYMLKLYTYFLAEGKGAITWEAPLLAFLRSPRRAFSSPSVDVQKTIQQHGA